LSICSRIGLVRYDITVRGEVSMKASSGMLVVLGDGGADFDQFAVQFGHGAPVERGEADFKKSCP
jgi:hypothetical protein